MVSIYFIICYVLNILSFELFIFIWFAELVFMFTLLFIISLYNSNKLLF